MTGRIFAKPVLDSVLDLFIRGEIKAYPGKREDCEALADVLRHIGKRCVVRKYGRRWIVHLEGWQG